MSGSSNAASIVKEYHACAWKSCSLGSWRPNGAVGSDYTDSGCLRGSCLQACLLLRSEGTDYFGNPQKIVSEFCGGTGCFRGGFTQCRDCDHGAGEGIGVARCTATPPAVNCNAPDARPVGARPASLRSLTASSSTGSSRGPRRRSLSKRPSLWWHVPSLLALPEAAIGSGLPS